MSIGRGRHGREMGPIGYCICLRCGYRVRKIPGVRCLEMKCPKCDAAMIREGFASLYVFGHWFIFSPHGRSGFILHCEGVHRQPLGNGTSTHNIFPARI